MLRARHALWNCALAAAASGASSSLSRCSAGSEEKPKQRVERMKEAARAFDFSELQATTQKVFNGEESSAALASAFGGQVNRFLASGVPAQLSWGFISGFCSGFAVKKASKVAAVGVGATFCALQAMSYSGFITVDYNKVETGAMSYLDMDGDGKVDYKDVSLMYDKLMDVLAFNLPAGSGFASGVVMGLQRG